MASSRLILWIYEALKKVDWLSLHYMLMVFYQFIEHKYQYNWASAKAKNLCQKNTKHAKALNNENVGNSINGAKSLKCCILISKVVYKWNFWGNDSGTKEIETSKLIELKKYSNPLNG